MNFQFNLPDLQPLAAKLLSEDFSFEDAKEMKKLCVESRKQICRKIEGLGRILDNTEIRECQLPTILAYLENTTNQKAFQNILPQIIKFFQPEFDHRPDSQRIALRIYTLISIYSETNEIIDEQEVKLILRMINRFDLSALNGYTILLNKFMRRKIVEFIEKYLSLDILMNFFRLDIGNSKIQDNCQFLTYHVLGYNKALNQLEKQGRKCQKAILKSIDEKFLRTIRLLIELLDQHPTFFAKQQILMCLDYMLGQLPIFSFSFKDFYLNQTETQNEYENQKQQIAIQLLNTAKILQLLWDQTLFLVEDNHNFLFNIFNILSFMVPQITINSFRMFVIPHILFYFKNQVHPKNIESFCKLCITFIYFNQDIEESAELFKQLFCQSGIFDQIIEKIDMRVEKMLKIIHDDKQYERERVKQSLKLFQMLVVAFQIISHSNIQQQIYVETRDLLEKSVKFFKDISNHKWAGQTLDELLQGLKQKEKQTNIPNRHRYLNKHNEFEI